MFENENEGFEGTDASTESSTANESTSSQSEGQGQQAQGTDTNNSDVSTPFHEHPRFKELVEQKNTFSRQFQESQKALREMQTQLQKLQQNGLTAQQREDALHARLKGIDPEFGERFAKVDSSLAELAELKQWKQEFEMQRVRERGVSMVNELHTKNKVSSEMQELYNSQIEDMVRRNPRLTLDELPEVYKAVHDKMSKMFDGFKRTERESYVTDKKKDAGIPSTPKGKTPSTAKKGVEYSKDPYEARQQMVQEIRAQLRTKES